MSKKDDVADLHISVADMRESAQRILKYLDGQTDESFLSNQLKQDAVLRCIQIFDEIARRIRARCP